MQTRRWLLLGPVYSLCVLCLSHASETVPPAAPAGSSSPLPAPSQGHVAELVARDNRSIVVIRPQSRDGDALGLGTGFVIDASGLIATAYHVIGDARPIVVETLDGKTLRVKEIFASDRHLDLAILRVDGENLAPLVLSKGPPLPPGASALALGHPLGLEHSVVTGVISAPREIEGRPMIQVAMPIEPGHSGGPLLDADRGEVQGIIVMKSTGTDQLGFAVPVNQLQRIWDNPNPVLMEQWMTIGRLDATRWSTVFGGDWRQRAGRILVGQPGEGFGGRTLCLAKRTPPALPMELGVWVKLDDETGAAGLVFHSDGEHRHYGFYPSGGNLRLTCFEGPTVYSWDILANLHFPAYHAGEWNYLKVRLEPDRIQCFVNDELAVESRDARLTSGQVGLAKFRQTHAEFRDFNVAATLPPAFPTHDQVTAVNNLLSQLPGTPLRTPGHLDPLLRSPQAARVLQREADRLKAEAEQLTQLANTLHTQQICRELALWQQQDPQQRSLFSGALLISKLDNPGLDTAAYEGEIEKMVASVRGRMRESNPSDEIVLSNLDQYLFQDLGYHGSRTEYYHPANSYLDRVIDDREGLPITLSVLYMELGARLGLNIDGIGLPGHFVVQFRPKSGESTLIDPFDRARRLTRADAARIMAEFTGEVLTDEHLSSVSDEQILVRMLNNLMGIAQRRDDRVALGRYLEVLVTLVPDNASFRGMRAVLRRETGQVQAALDDLDWLLEHPSPALDSETVQRMRDTFASELPSPMP